MKNQILGDKEISEKFQFVTLEKMRIAFQRKIDPVIIQDLHFSSFQDRMLMDMIQEIRGHFWAENPRSISFSFPADWIEAFKNRWFPKWALKKWPVKMTIKTLKGQLFYPCLPQTTPQHQHRIRFAIMNGNGSADY